MDVLETGNPLSLYTLKQRKSAIAEEMKIKTILESLVHDIESESVFGIWVCWRPMA